jgi:ATP-dependent DNA ligase
VNLPFQPPLTPMEAKHVPALPTGEGWQYEPKWDGFRAICFRDGDDVYISSRKELPFVRYFPEIVDALRTLTCRRCVLDGEIVVFRPDGRALDFDALLQRIHPAESRVRRLSKETPASFVAFDLLAVDDEDLRGEPLAARRPRLERTLTDARAPVHLSPCTDDPSMAYGWLERFDVQGLDGVVAKRLTSLYRSAEREMLKVKRERTADCIVIGFRWAKGQQGQAIGSLLLGLYGPDGELWQVGFSSGFTQGARRDLVGLVEPYRTGRSEEPPPGQAPMSRWTRDKDLSYEKLRPDLVCEVAFDQVTGHRIRHGARFVRWRPDKPASACTFDQLVRPPDQDLRSLFG